MRSETPPARMRRLNALSLTLALLIASSAEAPAVGGPTDGALPTLPALQTPQTTDFFARDGLIRGLSLEASRRTLTAGDLASVLETGAEWIAQTPFGFQAAVDSPEIRMPWQGRVMWGESDEGIRETTRLAKQAGMRVMLKPQLWIRRGPWVGEIAMQSEQEWARWWEDYSEYILHFASLAEELGIDLFAVGTELQATVGREAEWRRIIAAVREVYSGPLTYSANWNESYRNVPFWDALDYIGVSAYFPVPVEPSALAAGREAASRAIQAAWDPHRRQLALLSARVGRPLIFTEAGYRSLDGALQHPWEWRGRGAVNLELQEAAYDALLATFWEEEWFSGVFFWNWSPRREGGPSDRGYTPRNKPAADVMARWFGQVANPRGSSY